MEDWKVFWEVKSKRISDIALEEQDLFWVKDRLELLYSKEEIQRRVKQLIQILNKDYEGRKPIIIGILKGSFMFLSDIVRGLSFPLRIEFVRLSSYGEGTESKGRVDIEKDIEIPLEGEDILVIEDIVDSATTLSFFKERTLKKNPRSFKICTLIDKKCRRKAEIDLDYVGFQIEDGFLVGYGLDYAESYRHLPQIYRIINT